MKTVSTNVALLSERLGWRGPEGFERLRQVPEQTVRDWLTIADMEREKEQRNAN